MPPALAAVRRPTPPLDARPAGFLDLERSTLQALAGTRRGEVNIVFLTPGFRHPSYFEHAYKARLLGFPLVEPADLTVREGRLFLKTLAGLQRIDGVVCRIDQDGIDPLEHWGCADGVPGTIEVWRSGNVALANMPGSRFASSPALMPFFPRICREWFGEEMKLPFVETWWLGQEESRRRVMDQLHRFILLSAAPEVPSRIAEQLFWVGRYAERIELATRLLRTLDTLVLHLAAFAGMQAENMTRGHGWRFLEMGRRIERALGGLHLLRTAAEQGRAESAALDQLLETCDSVMTYRRRHFSRPRLDAVTDLIFFDRSNPRSVSYQLAVIQAEITRFTAKPDFGLMPAIRQHVQRLDARFADTRPPEVAEYLAMNESLEGLSDLLTQHFFSHSVRRVYETRDKHANLPPSRQVRQDQWVMEYQQPCLADGAGGAAVCGLRAAGFPARLPGTRRAHRPDPPGFS